jgi:hypothetical protein
MFSIKSKVMKITPSLLHKFGFGLSHYKAHYYFNIVEGKISKTHFESTNGNNDGSDYIIVFSVKKICSKKAAEKCFHHNTNKDEIKSYVLTGLELQF